MNFIESPVDFRMLGALAVQLLRMRERSPVLGRKRNNS